MSKSEKRHYEYGSLSNDSLDEFRIPWLVHWRLQHKRQSQWSLGIRILNFEFSLNLFRSRWANSVQKIAAPTKRILAWQKVSKSVIWRFRHFFYAFWGHRMDKTQKSSKILVNFLMLSCQFVTKIWKTTFDYPKGIH